jgi:hypothetical protein
MIRDYMITSPSLDGILSHDSITYEGINRPTEIIRAFDRPKNQQIPDTVNPEKQQILQDYFNDLYGLFMRKMSHFIADNEVNPDNELKLIAMVQELIKVKKLLTERHII